ncbi:MULTISPECIES: Panacea domain-containing protein [Calothrix]|uniref:SocA family protein n=2 Tax=Calothrix TaxID=1186 RepID=A0ABR8A7M0_9CYAN|nr:MULTISPECIES: type II toxin-antitoxin system antitoxin SocA domain-containing protein [Calothrix]MBD2195916.1 SocA family protein [Calothrix parietina FACHB-288]MBD2227630.1 SocA family protein [Calothrix anomala FACHB-343]
MIDCLNVARYFIVKAYEDGIEAEMTNMKVQKLLYYSQSLHLALYDEPLFDEEIQAWRYGPVCPPAYRFYSEFEANQLPVPSKDFLLQISDEQKKLLAEIWEYFGGYHAYRLSDMTHGEFPWKKARKGLPPQASSTEPIRFEDMKALGYQKLDIIERENPAYESVMSKTVEEAINSESSTRVSKGEVRDWLKSLLD